MYVSALVFGDQKAAFLLPWRRHFNLTDAQLFVARRDNAKAIFKIHLESKGGDLPADRYCMQAGVLCMTVVFWLVEASAKWCLGIDR